MLGRSHAAHARCARCDDGLPDGRAHDLGESTGLPLLQPRDGALIGSRAASPRAALAPDRGADLSLRRGFLQLRRSSPVQAEVPAGVAFALPRGARRRGAAEGAARRIPAGVGRRAAHGIAPRRRTMRLLLTEDDAMIGEAVQRGLRQLGFAVDWVRDGAAAAQALAVGSYDLLLLDLGLPR